MGSGAATLWYAPSSPRAAFTTSETAAGISAVVDGVQFLPLEFKSEGEEQSVQARALLNDDGGVAQSTAGAYMVTF